MNWTSGKPIVVQYDLMMNGIKAGIVYDPFHESNKYPRENKWRWETWYGKDLNISRGDGWGLCATVEDAMRNAERWITMFAAESADPHSR